MSEFETRPEKQYKPKKKHRALSWLIIFLVIVIVTVICSMLSYKYVIKNTVEPGQEVAITIDTKDKIEVDIPIGSGSKAIIKLLEEKGIINHPSIFKFMSRINGFDGTYQAGTHILSKKLSYTDIMRILSDKPLSLPSIRVTIPEGWTYKQLEAYLSENKLIDKAKFDEAVNNENFEYKFMKDMPKRERRLEGYLFPETYFVEMKTPEKDIVNIFLRQFNKIFKTEYYEKAKSMNMSVDDIIILASIIEREAKVPEERPLIAGVFYNRLKSKDKTLHKLQSCATIQYIFYNKEGIIKDQILDADTKIDDPYNTYLNDGLPPGPICNPGELSILAALNPEESNYYYFVARDDGSGAHYFSKTFKEHLNNQALAARNKSKK